MNSRKIAFIGLFVDGYDPETPVSTEYRLVSDTDPEHYKDWLMFLTGEPTFYNSIIFYNVISSLHLFTWEIGEQHNMQAQAGVSRNT